MIVKCEKLLIEHLTYLAAQIGIFVEERFSLPNKVRIQCLNLAINLTRIL